jgi:hypothetical protein
MSVARMLRANDPDLKWNVIPSSSERKRRRYNIPKLLLILIQLDRKLLYAYSLSLKAVSHNFLSSNKCKEAGIYMQGKLALQGMYGTTKDFYQKMVRATCCLFATSFVQYYFHPVAGNTFHLKSTGHSNLAYSILLFQMLFSFPILAKLVSYRIWWLDDTS